MSILIAELKKENYEGLTVEQILDALPSAETAIGRIQGVDKLDLITLVISNDIIDRLLAESVKNDEAIGYSAEGCETYRKLAKVLASALEPNLVMTDVYRINLGLDEIKTLFDAAHSFSLLTDDEYSKIIELATYVDGDDFSVFDLDDVILARLKISPTTDVECDTQGVGYIVNKYRNIVVVEATITESLDYPDTITFTCQSGNSDENGVTNYAIDDRQRAVIFIPAGFTGTKSSTINLSGLKTKVKTFAASKYSRNFTCSIANAVS